MGLGKTEVVDTLPFPEDVAHFAEAFSADCTISSSRISDWYLDTGSTHMTLSSSSLDVSVPYSGSDYVVVGDGNCLPSFHIGQ